MTRTPGEVFRHHVQVLGEGHGIDTFVFVDGQIRLQTLRYTLLHT